MRDLPGEGQRDSIRPAQLSAVTTVRQATLLALREAIAVGRYDPGQPLCQETLARDFGVSVPPVREALKTLEAEGQVAYAPRRGYCVARLSRAELREACRIPTPRQARPPRKPALTAWSLHARNRTHGPAAVRPPAG